MFRNCVTCGQRTIVGYYTDGHQIVMDDEPVTDGHAVLKGDIRDQPTVLFGVDNEADAEFWHVPFDSHRYDKHECEES